MNSYTEIQQSSASSNVDCPNCEDLKAAHCFYMRMLYRNMDPVKKEALREKSRALNKLRYNTDPGYRAKIKNYVNTRNASKWAAKELLDATDFEVQSSTYRKMCLSRKAIRNKNLFL